MITLAGSTHLSFTFPADIHTAFRYYSNIRRTLALLPHISMLREYSATQYRMLYATVELGIYQVQMTCDIQVLLNEAEGSLCIEPFDSRSQVRSAVSLHSLKAQGFYHSESIFRAREAAVTEIDYRLRLDARLPVPFASKILPVSVLDGIADNVANWRIHEIAQGFIQRSVEDYKKRLGNAR